MSCSAEAVDNLAADQWIIRQFVTRLPGRQQEVLRAAGGAAHRVLRIGGLPARRDRQGRRMV